VNGLSEVISVTCSDACVDGFIPSGQPDIALPYCDAIFLDVCVHCILLIFLSFFFLAVFLDYFSTIFLSLFCVMSFSAFNLYFEFISYFLSILTYLFFPIYSNLLATVTVARLGERKEVSASESHAVFLLAMH
jgi:hypothetical protein